MYISGLHLSPSVRLGIDPVSVSLVRGSWIDNTTTPVKKYRHIHRYIGRYMK